LKRERHTASSARPSSSPVDRCERRWHARNSDNAANYARQLDAEIVGGSKGARDVRAIWGSLLHLAGFAPRSALIAAHSRVPLRESRASVGRQRRLTRFTGELVREGSLSKRSRRAPISSYDHRRECLSLGPLLGAEPTSAFGGKADMTRTLDNVR
jgi:hypothetical protein